MKKRVITLLGVGLLACLLVGMWEPSECPLKEASPIKGGTRSFTNLCPELLSRNSPNELKPVLVDHNIQALAIA